MSCVFLWDMFPVGSGGKRSQTGWSCCMCMRFDWYLNILGGFKIPEKFFDICTKLLNRHIAWSTCSYSISMASMKWPQLSNPLSRESEVDRWWVSLSINCWDSSSTMRDKPNDLFFDRRRPPLSLHLIVIVGGLSNDEEIVNRVRDGSLDIGFRRDRTVIDFCELQLFWREAEKCMMVYSYPGDYS